MWVNTIYFGIDGIVVRSSEINFFKVAIFKCCQRQVTVGKERVSEVAFRKIGFVKLRVVKMSIFNLGLIERGVIEHAVIKREGKPYLVTRFKTQSEQLAVIKSSFSESSVV